MKTITTVACLATFLTLTLCCTSAAQADALRTVALRSTLAPGTSDNFVDFDDPNLNDLGQTAFFGVLNSSSGAINFGIWAEDLTGVLRLIVRTGDLLDVDDGPGTDFRTINSLAFSGSVDELAPADGFNNLGQLAFTARFTDGSGGVFVSDLVATLPNGDFDDDNDVDGSDFLTWQRTLGDSDSLALWEAGFGLPIGSVAAGVAVPEPSALALLVLGFACLARRSLPSLGYTSLE